jgi:DNA-binding transcriptional LysR family regulator
MVPILTRCFESAAAAEALAAGIGKGGALPLRVALSPTIGVELILATLEETTKVFDGLEVSVRRESAVGTLELLKTGEVEVVIAPSDDLELRPWLDRFPLFEEGFLLISPREHRLVNRASLGLEDLRDEQMVLQAHAEHLDALAALASRKGGHDVRSDADTAALVGAGLGVAIVPRSFPRPKSLAATPIADLDLRRSVSVFGAAGRPRSAPATMLINLLRAADWDAAFA